MSAQDLTIDEIQYFLTLREWQIHSTGPAGNLWLKVDDQGHENFIAVPTKPIPENIKWRDVIDRLSILEGKTFSDTKFRIQYPNLDVTRLRGTNDILIDETIPLKSGVGMVGSAYKMLRASATTARKLKGHIGGGYSKTGDEIVSQARLGQTEIGSYIIPILMPIPDMPQASEPFLQLEVATEFRAAYEPLERRVMRTFAQSLEALSEKIVQPGADPRRGQMAELIAAGVSREFVIAVNEILGSGSISSLDFSFDWAPSVTAPSNAPTQVSIPSESQELLVKTAKLLKTSRNDPNQSLTGPIVEAHYPQDDTGGTIGFQAFRNGRYSIIKVIMTESQIREALEYMHDKRTVVIAGRIRQEPGKPARIDRPTRFHLLNEEFLTE